jgi:hypothetical protein
MRITSSKRVILDVDSREMLSWMSQTTFPEVSPEHGPLDGDHVPIENFFFWRSS